jgi:demethylmenaquinone methyltransferase/2-methoxy-6-polyprenyl-1,4-benzoquinol methylase
MFNRVAHRYDVLNQILSFGFHSLWRRRLARFLSNQQGQRVLDLATGTGDQLLGLFGGGNQIGFAVGMDPAERMLDLGLKKLKRGGHGDIVCLLNGSATEIPVKDGEFDVVTISFGIRNVEDVSRALQEGFRVLKPGGCFLVLEFSLPGIPLSRGVYVIYLRKVLPRVGGIISGDAFAYRYLNETIETFPYGDRFCGLLTQAGFEHVVARPVTWGVVTVYRGVKPA